MKPIKNLLSIFVIITSLTFVSCENEPVDSSLLGNNGTGNNSGGGNSGGGGNTYYVKTKIDGVQKEWTGINATGVFLNNSIFTIFCGGTSTTETLSLTVNNTLTGPIAVANYPFEWALTTSVYTLNNVGYSSAYSDFTVSSGSINITQINTANNTIKGTFSFVAKNDGMTVSKNFTNGEFFLQYQ
jgi:hypothetical protein